MRAFTRAAKRAGVEFMVIGGTFRDAVIRAASTRDIDVVLIDQGRDAPLWLEAAGFERVEGSKYTWRFMVRGRAVDLEIAAIASSKGSGGPFSVAARHAEKALIEGVRVAVPRVEDYVILKLLAAASDARRRARDLADVQAALEAFPERARSSLSIAGLRGRLRDAYGIDGLQLRDLVALLRKIPRPA